MRVRSILPALLVSCALAAPAAALDSVVFLSTWGPDGAGQGRVYRYVSGTTWEELSPPGGLADAAWDLDFDGEYLWASTHAGPPSPRDATIPHGFSGRVFRYDGTGWTDMSPPAGFSSAATTVTSIEGRVFVTVDDVGLLEWTGGSSWDLVSSFDMAGQAIASSTHDGRPKLFIGQDNIDEFWAFDPDGAMPCGVPAPDPFGDPRCQVPAFGACSADCHGGSCIHAMTEFDDGSGVGSLVHAGAFLGRIYRWDRATRLFVRLDDVPDTTHPDLDLNHVQGLTSYRGRLWAGISDGRLWSSPDGTAPTYAIERDFSAAFPISELVTAPADDLAWIGFGGVPYRWARRTGTSLVKTFDGSRYEDRAAPGQFDAGVLCILPVVPVVTCHAGDDRVIECPGGTVAVDLHGSAHVPGALGLPLEVEWSGDFLEGTASGLDPVVHFDGLGDHVVTLTARAGVATSACTVTIRLVDSAPPVLVARDACLWPPDHRYRCFEAAELTRDLRPVALDACEGEVPVRIVDAYSSQPEDDTPGGDGRSRDDLLFDDDTICVRGERQGADRDGRTYTVVLVAEDFSGNVGTFTAAIRVPHDMRSERPCGELPRDTGLLPHAPLPLVGEREGAYPPPVRAPRPTPRR